MNRKTILLTATLLISASLFSMSEYKAEKDGRQHKNSGENSICLERESKNNKFDYLTPEKKTEVENILKKYSSDRKKIFIEVQEKEIAIDKLLIEEKIDWNKVEKAVTELSTVKSKLKVLNLKQKFEISQITGDDFFRFNRHHNKRNKGCHFSKDAE